jgi:uncharacterized protein YndB with AHSA1/START domain
LANGLGAIQSDGRAIFAATKGETPMTIPSETKSRPEASVRKTVVVNVPQANAFAVFTERHGEWWPLQNYHIGAQPPQTAILEPRPGGRWFERASDGSECDWGRVLVWEPPHRIVLSWEISADWKHDPNLKTEVEVRFIAEGTNRTRVELEHRGLDVYGARRDEMRGIFDSDRGWKGLLDAFAACASEGSRT